MARFVIKNVNEGKYLAIISPAHIAGGSYTTKLEEARTFRTREEAERQLCANELVYNVDKLLQPPVKR